MSLSETVYKAQDDMNLRNAFIVQYKPFIAKCVYSITGRSVVYGVDDELSIALIAFNYAIDKYDGRGSFLSFAKLVIRNKLYDYFRNANRHTSLNEALFDEDDNENASLQKLSISKNRMDDESFDLKEEISAFVDQLKEYGITLNELVKMSPKHKQKRKVINEVINYIIHNDEAMKYFENSGNIPLRLAAEALGFPKKNIEPYRKYIIAMLIISKGEYFYLKEYLKI